MRRLFASLLASTVLATLVGCNHTGPHCIVGKCDCANGLDACCNNGWGWIGQAGPVVVAPTAAPAVAPAAEPIKEPKASN